MLFERQYIKSRTFNDKNRSIIKKVMVLKKLFPHLATRGTYSPGDWRCDEAWHEQTLEYPPVIYCTWELNVMCYDAQSCPGTAWWNPSSWYINIRVCHAINGVVAADLTPTWPKALTLLFLNITNLIPKRPIIAHLRGRFRPWTYMLNIGFNMLHSDFMSCLDSPLGYSTGEF